MLILDAEPTSKPVNNNEYPKIISREHSKEISTSDEMVFAVTPTGLERVSFEKYWQDCKIHVYISPLYTVIVINVMM